MTLTSLLVTTEIFRRLHKQRNESDVMETVRNLLPGVTVETIRLFIQLIFEDIVGELLTEQLKIGKKCSQKNHEAITENDQSILYYIAGYIVRSLKKKYQRCPNISYVNDLTNASGGHSLALGLQSPRMCSTPCTSGKTSSTVFNFATCSPS